MDKIEIEKQLKKIKDEVLKCQKCSLFKTRKFPVIGQGNHQAKIIFIGEAPGASENLTGVPFCGAAGKILDELLESIGIKKEDVYIANILKCRPPGNRNPEKKEIEDCTPYLEKQIKIINPKVICALGNFSTGFILEKYGLKDQIQGISKIHGKIFDPLVNENDLKIISFYHPAAAAYNSNMKEILKKDFEVLREFKD
jgi:uracil-DNA glycosylase family 4